METAGYGLTLQPSNRRTGQLSIHHLIRKPSVEKGQLVFKLYLVSEGLDLRLNTLCKYDFLAHSRQFEGCNFNYQLGFPLFHAKRTSVTIDLTIRTVEGQGSK